MKFGIEVYLDNIWVDLEGQGKRSKFKVTRSKICSLWSLCMLSAHEVVMPVQSLGLVWTKYSSCIGHRQQMWCVHRILPYFHFFGDFFRSIASLFIFPGKICSKHVNLLNWKFDYCDHYTPKTGLWIKTVCFQLIQVWNSISPMYENPLRWDAVIHCHVYALFSRKKHVWLVYL